MLEMGIFLAGLLRQALGRPVVGGTCRRRFDDSFQEGKPGGRQVGEFDSSRLRPNRVERRVLLLPCMRRRPRDRIDPVMTLLVVLAGGVGPACPPSDTLRIFQEPPIPYYPVQRTRQHSIRVGVFTFLARGCRRAEKERSYAVISVWYPNEFLASVGCSPVNMTSLTIPWRRGLRSVGWDDGWVDVYFPFCVPFKSTLRVLLMMREG